MEYLLRDDLILINRMTIEVHGGSFTPPENLLNAGSLGYVSEAVQAEILGQKLQATNTLDVVKAWFEAHTSPH